MRTSAHVCTHVFTHARVRTHVHTPDQPKCSYYSDASLFILSLPRITKNLHCTLPACIFTRVQTHVDPMHTNACPHVCLYLHVHAHPLQHTMMWVAVQGGGEEAEEEGRLLTH